MMDANQHRQILQALLTEADQHVRQVGSRTDWLRNYDAIDQEYKHTLEYGKRLVAAMVALSRLLEQELLEDT